MRCSALVVLTFVAWVSGSPGVVEPNLARGYHVPIGIPKAAQIKQNEDRISAESKTSRIVGGSEAAIIDFPFLAGLLITLPDINGVSVCGATLVSRNRLVGAAHCWFDGVHRASEYTVVLGSSLLFSGGLRIQTTQVFTYPQWSPVTLANDLAMIYLPSQITFTDLIQPANIPETYQLGENFAGERATAIGYGKTSDQQPITSAATSSSVTMIVISEDECSSVFGNATQPTNICTSGTGGVGICGGDDGGPLSLIRSGLAILVGISSYTAAAGCELGFPSVFTRVTSYRSYITQHIQAGLQ